MSQKIFLCVTLDTECDKSINWETRFPLEFRSVLEGIPNRLTPLFDPYHIQPTYFLSPEVMQDADCSKFLSGLKNCELGTHLHAEFIEPEAQPQARITQIVQAKLPYEIEQQKLANLTQLFKDRFGYPPTSFRAGRFGMSRSTLSILGELGYQVDSSVTPFYAHDFNDGIVNDYWGAPIEPYLPSHADFRKRGSSKVLEVPITVINPTLLRWPKWILRRVNIRTFFQKRLLPRLGVKVQKTKWLRPKYSTGEEMIAIADQALQNPVGNKPHVLTLMFHTDEVIPGASPYASTDEEVDIIINSLKTFFEHLFNHYKVETTGISRVYPLFR